MGSAVALIKEWIKETSCLNFIKALDEECLLGIAQILADETYKEIHEFFNAYFTWEARQKIEECREYILKTQARPCSPRKFSWF